MLACCDRLNGFLCVGEASERKNASVRRQREEIKEKKRTPGLRPTSAPYQHRSCLCPQMFLLVYDTRSQGLIPLLRVLQEELAILLFEVSR